MVWKAIQNIKSIGFMKGDVVPEGIAKRLVEAFEIDPVAEVSDAVVGDEKDDVVDKLPVGIKGRVKDFVGDLVDDGKRNYSNRKKKNGKKQ